MRPKSITVVLPHFNDPNGLKKSINSVLAQSVLPVELIVIDDCSDPPQVQQATEIVEAAGADNGSVVASLISTGSNSGPSAARNLGIEKSTCDYVAFLDCGDTWAREKLKLQVEIFESRPQTVFSAHRVAVENISGSDERDGYLPYTLPKFWKWMLRNRATTSTVMMRRVANSRFDEEMSRAEDFDLWLRLLASYGPQPVSRQALAFKPVQNYMGAGLSSDLVGMEIGELKALRKNKPSGAIGSSLYLAAAFWSVLKFARRFLTRKFRTAVCEGEE